jgi:guanylate kinase
MFMPDEPIDFNVLHPEPLLIVISGPSGVGKDAVLREMKCRKLDVSFVVTTTSRPPRPEEVEGVDYHFVSKEEFEVMVENGKMLEHALVYQDYKGLQAEHVRAPLQSGKDVVIRVDVQGAARYRSLCPDALLIFLIPTNEQEWFQRLKSRRTETPESLKIRVGMAKKELECLSIFDYVIVNAENRLGEVVDTIEDIIRAEHHRIHPRKITL